MKAGDTVYTIEDFGGAKVMIWHRRVVSVDADRVRLEKAGIERIYESSQVFETRRGAEVHAAEILEGRLAAVASRYRDAAGRLLTGLEEPV